MVETKFSRKNGRNKVLVQSNLSIARTCLHLVIAADTFSRNGPKHAQTLTEIALYSGKFYSGHIFSEPREHLP